MRIATNISTSYAKTWGAEQALVELLQNVLDARDAGASMSITRDDGILTIVDTGPGLDKRHLALGVSEKSAESRGQFGEGLKLALLVLARMNRAVMITSGDMVIMPAVADVGLDVPCLVMDIAEAPHMTGTRIDVECTQEEEDAAKARFAEWQPIDWIDKDKGLSTPGGNIFVNGILAGSVKDAVFSYHLTGERAQKIANRDRTAVDMTAFANLAADLFHTCNRAAAEMLLPKLTADSACWEQSLWVNWLEKTIWQPAILATWGRRIVITDDTANVDRMEYLGYTPVHICSRWQWGVAALCVPLQKAQAALAKEARIDADLTHRESEVLRAALDRMARHGVTIDPSIVHVARTLSMDSGTVCDGLRIGKEIWLAASTLKTARTVIPVLVHEWAHIVSDASDCSAEFEAALLDIGIKLAFGREP